MTGHGLNLQPESLAALAVGQSGGDLTALTGVFNEAHWTLKQAGTCLEALRHLRESRTPVVLCERDLPDGNWSKVYRLTAQLPVVPLLIVTSRCADELLWAEVLNSGGYDVLCKPFERVEIIRVVGSAWRHSREQAERKPPGQEHGRVELKASI
jgi:DNA-binding response OmpR family regulator